MALTMKVTNAGRAALVNAQNTGTAPVTITQFGLSATAITPTGGETVLAGEIKRIATLSGDVVDDDTIHLVVRDESTAAFTMRSWALYLDDGTLFGIYGQATPIVSKTEQSMMLLAIDVRFADIDAAALEFGDTNFLNPPATTEVQGVVELATSAEAQTGTDLTRAVTPKAIRDAVFAWLDARFGANNSGIWHPGNDGAGSGLDADMLDGLQASAFALAGHLHDERYVRSVAGNLRITSEPYQLAIASAPTGYTGGWARGVTIAGNSDDIERAHFGAYGAASTPSYAYISIASITGSTAHSQSNSFRVTSTEARWGSNRMWHAGNDGAGSGLDADLLDGLQASAFATAGHLHDDRYVRSSSSALRIATEAGNLALATAASGFTGTWARGLTFAGNSDDVSRAHFGAYGDGTGTTPAYAFIGIGPATGGIHSQANTFRILSDEVRWGANRIWHAGNDGSGSGLDADLLDGLHASSFAQLSGANFTGEVRAPVLRPGTIADAWISANGGALVVNWDANDWMEFDRAANRLKQFIGLVSQFEIGADGWVSARSGFHVNGNPVWHQGNDGSGSGNDADMLDGLHASDFLRVIAQSITGNGYVRLSNGLVIQWGLKGSAGIGSFPIAFPSQCLRIIAGNADGQGSKIDNAYAYPVSASQYYSATKTDAGEISNYPVSWIAIGI